MNVIEIQEVPNDLQNDLVLMSSGKISLDEYQRRCYTRQKLLFLPQLQKYRKGKNWNEFINTALTVYEVMPEAFQYFHEIPDNLKYQFAVEAYTNHGDSIPGCRKAVRSALRYGKPVLPEEMASKDVIAVYRAGEEPIEKAKYRISWTTSLDVAKFFMFDYNGRHANHLYSAKIKTADIIAFFDDRNEKEVMQYCKVFDIQEMETAE